jgi:hypothetical protein
MRARRSSTSRRLLLLVVMVAGATAGSAVWTNAFGAGDRFERLVDRIELALDPPPNRPTRQTITVTPRPTVAAPAAAAKEESRPAGPARSATKPTRPPATPVRKPVDFAIARNPGGTFASQLTKEWCAPAGVQIVLSILGRADNSPGFQRELVRRIDEWESWQDSHNGGWGPAAIAEALQAYGAPGYEIRAYESRADALRDSAVALTKTRAPVVLIAWRGAHTWVMTGYRANADPTVFADATVSGAYVYDPWYPRVSNIWGRSDAPGTFQDAAEMNRNFLPWKRPEGRYADRDGKFIVLVPTIPAAPAR